MADVLGMLTREDVAFLRSWIERERKKPIRLHAHVPNQLPQAPDVYIAFTLSGGIPALSLGAETGTGTGTVNEDDVPGSGLCEIYRINSAGLFTPLHLRRLVYNLSTTAIPGSAWIPIGRDKWGKWLALGTGQGSAGDLDTGTGTTPTCSSIRLYEADILCESEVESTGTGTGTGTTSVSSNNLNLYRRYVEIGLVNGCLTREQGPWEFVRTVSCCDPSCIPEDDGETGTGTGTGTGGDVEPAESCDNATIIQLGVTYGPFATTELVPNHWFKLDGLAGGDYRAIMTVIDIDEIDPVGAVNMVNSDCEIGPSGVQSREGPGEVCVDSEDMTPPGFEGGTLIIQCQGGSETPSPMTYTIRVESGLCP